MNFQNIHNSLKNNKNFENLNFLKILKNKK